LGGIGVLFEGDKPTKAPCGDGTAATPFAPPLHATGGGIKMLKHKVRTTAVKKSHTLARHVK